MGLRHRDGLDLRRLDAMGQDRPADEIIADLKAAHMIDLSGDRVALTQTGRLLADYVAAQLSP